jgi:hypothetical protein
MPISSDPSDSRFLEIVLDDELHRLFFQQLDKSMCVQTIRGKTLQNRNHPILPYKLNSPQVWCRLTSLGEQGRLPIQPFGPFHHHVE